MPNNATARMSQSDAEKVTLLNEDSETSTSGRVGNSSGISSRLFVLRRPVVDTVTAVIRLSIRNSMLQTVNDLISACMKL